MYNSKEFDQRSKVWRQIVKTLDETKLNKCNDSIDPILQTDIKFDDPDALHYYQVSPSGKDIIVQCFDGPALADYFFNQIADNQSPIFPNNRIKATKRQILELNDRYPFLDEKKIAEQRRRNQEQKIEE